MAEPEDGVPRGSSAAVRAGRRLVLLLEPDAALRRRLGQGLREAGYAVRATADLAEALEALAGPPADLILAAVAGSPEAPPQELDPDAAPQLIQRLLAFCPTVLCLLRSPDPERAAALIAAGAYDVLPRPCRPAEALLALAKAEARELHRGDPTAARFRAISEPAPAPASASGASVAAGPVPPPTAELPGIIATAPRMLALLAKVRRLAAHPHTSVLFTGESGTGKELLARALHRLSPRHAGPFVAVNCGAIPETLLEGLLFGHVRGAFTDAVRDQPGLFAQASSGTVFLDEIGELPLGLQVKLLRVLQERAAVPLGASVAVPFDVRVVAATLRNLEVEVAAGRFRADLYYRLSVVTLEVPPLRERAVDILPLARAFLRAASERMKTPLQAFTPSAEQALLRYPWPGNVRELGNTIERAAVLCERTIVDVADLPLAMALSMTPAGSGAASRTNVGERAAAAAPIPGSMPAPALGLGEDELSIKQAVRRVEILLIQRALTRTHGNRRAAARLLELSHPALLYKLRDYGLDQRPSARAKPADDRPADPADHGDNDRDDPRDEKDRRD